jgi:hypothetical protein
MVTLSGISDEAAIDAILLLSNAHYSYVYFSLLGGHPSIVTVIRDAELSLCYNQPLIAT